MSRPESEIGTKDKKNISFRLKVAQAAAAVLATAAGVGGIAYGASRLSDYRDNLAASRVEQVASDLSRKDFTSLNLPISIEVPSSWKSDDVNFEGRKVDVLTGGISHVAMTISLDSRSFPGWITLEGAARNVADEIKTKSPWASVKVLSEKETEADSEIESFKKINFAGQKTHLIYINNASGTDGFLYTNGNLGPLKEGFIAVFQDPNSDKVVMVRGRWESSLAYTDTLGRYTYLSEPRVSVRERDVALGQLREAYESIKILPAENFVVAP